MLTGRTAILALAVCNLISDPQYDNANLKMCHNVTKNSYVHKDMARTIQEVSLHKECVNAFGDTLESFGNMPLSK